VTVTQLQFDQAIWKVVENIPAGCVMSYGEVARAAGFPRHARMVSRALVRHAASRNKKALPWHRVLRQDRRIAFAPGSQEFERQKSLLQKEGLLVVAGKVCQSEQASKAFLDKLLWQGEL